MADLGTLRATLGVDIKPLQQARVHMTQWTRDADRNMGQAQRATGRLDSAFGALGATMAAVLSTRQIVKFTQTAVASFGAMEQSIANASTLFGTVEVDVANLQAQITALSGETGVAAEAIGQALYQALSAGIPVTRDMGAAMGFVRQAVILARAGFTDVTTAVEATAKTLNAYRLEVTEAERIHRILIQTQNRGITLVDELGSYLAQVTPIAAAFGVSFENVGAALAAMTAQGLRTRVAITQLRSLFTELGQSGTSGSEALLRAQQAAGMAQLSFTELMNSGYSLGAVLDLVRDYADTTGKSVIDLFGSVEAGQAVLSLTGANAEYLAMVFGEMSTESELVGESYAKVMDTLVGSTGVFRNNVRLLGTTVGQLLAPALTDVIERLTTWFVAARELIAQNLEVYAARFAAAVAFMLDNLDKVAFLIKGIVLMKLATWFQLATVGAYGFATALTVAATAARTLGRVLVYGLIAEAIGLVIDAFQDINDVVQNTSATWGDAAIIGIDGYVNGIINGLEWLGRVLPRLVGRLISEPLAASISTLFSWDSIKLMLQGHGMEAIYQATVAGGNVTDEIIDEIVSSYKYYDTRRPVKIASDEVVNRWTTSVAQRQREKEFNLPVLDGADAITEITNSWEQMVEDLLAGLGTSQTATQRYVETLKNDYRRFQDELTLADHEGWAARILEIDLWAAALTDEIKAAEAWSDEVSHWIDEVVKARKALLGKEQTAAINAATTQAETAIKQLQLETEAKHRGPQAWLDYQQQHAMNEDLKQYVDLLKEAGAEQSFINEFTNDYKQWTEANIEAQKSMERWTAIAETISGAIGSVFQQLGDHIIHNLVRGKLAFEDFGELALNILEQVLQQMLLVAIINPLTSGAESLITKLFTKNADGNAYGPRGLVPFAAGGVVTRPTVFPFANGVGLMGEAGPEGILPLTRVGGKLGVSAVGGGNVVVNINNQGPPLEVASRNQRQGADGEMIIDLAVRGAINRLDGQGQLDDVFHRHGASRKGVR